MIRACSRLSASQTYRAESYACGTAAFQRQRNEAHLHRGRCPVQCLHSLGNTYNTMQSYERASRSFRQSLRLKSRIGVKATSGSLIGLAVAEENLGHTSAAVRVYRQALRVARSQGNRDHVVRIYNNLGEIYQNRGEYGDAVKVYSKAITLAQELGARDLGVLCRANRALALAELSKRGRREEGISEIKQLATKSGLP